jgi:hypothetical protein
MYISVLFKVDRDQPNTTYQAAPYIWVQVATAVRHTVSSS